MRTLLLLSFLLATTAWSCKKNEEPAPGPTAAFATLYSTGSTGIRQIGEARFRQEGGIVTIAVDLYNLPAGGRHALKLYEGSCEDPGMVWNGGSSELYCFTPSMGDPWGRPYLGDIGNLQLDAQGRGSLSLQTDLWSLGDGAPLDILDKVLMVHAEAEDFIQECDPTHTDHPHNNPTIACGQVFKQVW